jgi:hypothetical protein
MTQLLQNFPAQIRAQHPSHDERFGLRFSSLWWMLTPGDWPASTALNRPLFAPSSKTLQKKCGIWLLNLGTKLSGAGGAPLYNDATTENPDQSCIPVEVQGP